MTGIARTFVALAAALLGSCTVAMWSRPRTDSWPSRGYPQAWQPAYVTYLQIESAAVRDDRLYLRIARSSGAPLVCAAPLAELWRAVGRGEPRTIDDLHERLLVVAVEPAEGIPDSVQPVRVVGRDGIREFQGGERGMPDGAPALLVELREQVVFAMSTRRPSALLMIQLSDPPLDWSSLNVIGHVLVTPVGVAIDIVMLPCYAFFGLLSLVPAGH
jgi:hypothetical protein